MGVKNQKWALIVGAVVGITISLFGYVEIGASVTFASFIVYFCALKSNKD